MDLDIRKTSQASIIFYGASQFINDRSTVGKHPSVQNVHDVSYSRCHKRSYAVYSAILIKFNRYLLNICLCTVGVISD